MSYPCSIFFYFETAVTASACCGSRITSARPCSWSQRQQQRRCGRPRGSTRQTCWPCSPGQTTFETLEKKFSLLICWMPEHLYNKPSPSLQCHVCWTSSIKWIPCMFQNGHSQEIFPHLLRRCKQQEVEIHSAKVCHLQLTTRLVNSHVCLQSLNGENEK